MLWAEEELVQPTPLSEQDGAKIGRKSVSTCVKCEVWGLSFRSSKIREGGVDPVHTELCCGYRMSQQREEPAVAEIKAAFWSSGLCQRGFLGL